MKFRKFTVLDIELSPGNQGPEQLFKVHYRAIVDKKWKTGSLWMFGKNRAEATKKAISRFGQTK